MENSLILQNATIADLEKMVTRVVRAEMDKVIKTFNPPTVRSRIVPRKIAAKELGVSLTTIDTWSKNGIIRPIHRGGRTYYDLNEIQK